MAEIKNTEMIRDALGSPIPQKWDEESQAFIASTVDGSAADVDFSKTKMIRDRLGSPIPQKWDNDAGKFVPSAGGVDGEVTIESIPGLQTELNETAVKLAETATKVTKNTPLVQPTQPANPFEGMIWFDTSRNKQLIDTFEAVDNTIPNQKNYSVLKRSAAASGSVLSTDSDIRIIGNKLNMKAKDTDLSVGSGIDAYADTTLLFNTPVDLTKGDISVEFDSIIEIIPTVASILRSFEVRFTDVKANVRSGENTWVRINITDGNFISVSSWANGAQTTDPATSSNKLDALSHTWKFLFRKADKRVLVYKDGIQILISNINVIPLTLGYVELVCSNKNNGATGIFTNINIDNLKIKYTS